MTFLFTTLRAFLFFRFFLRLSSFAQSESEGVDGWGKSSGSPSSAPSSDSVSSYGGEDRWCDLSWSEDNSDRAEKFDCKSSTFLFCNGISDVGSLNKYQVNFSYRAQLRKNNTDYIASIEKAMSRTIKDAVLDCSSYNTKAPSSYNTKESVRKLSVRRNLAIVATDSLPEDTKSSVRCEVSNVEAKFCQVVDAAISFVIDDGEASAVRNQVLDAIRSAIESKAYIGIEETDENDKKVPPNIVSIAYGLDSDDRTPPIAESRKGDDTDTTSLKPAMITVGASLILLIAAVSIRRRVRADVDDENSIFSNADYESGRSIDLSLENQDPSPNTDISLEPSAPGFETSVFSKDEEVDVEAVYDVRSVIPQDTILL